MHSIGFPKSLAKAVKEVEQIRNTLEIMNHKMSDFALSITKNYIASLLELETNKALYNLIEKGHEDKIKDLTATAIDIKKKKVIFQKEKEPGILEILTKFSKLKLK